MEYQHTLTSLPYTILAQADYSCGAYGEGAYTEACVTEGEGGGGLAGTGYDILLPIFLGVAVIFASIILIIKRLRRRNKSQNTA